MKTFARSAVVIVGLLITSYFAGAQTGNYFAGPSAGSGNTGSYNTFVGYIAGANANVGFHNSFFGYSAGYSNRTGNFNTYAGGFAGYFNISASENNAFGYSAATYNTGNGNSFFGSFTGQNSAGNNNNAFFGNYAAYDNNGNNNSFFGFRAGRANKASDNTFLGYFAGDANTSGNWNAFVGANSGVANTTGNHNTFVGMRSGPANTTGYRNAFFGTESGMLTTTGRENTFIGRGSGRNNTTGSFNTMLGNYAQPSTGNINYSTAIGHKAYVRVSNAVVLGSINGENSATVTTRVGIGTSAPAYLLHVNGVAAKPGGGSWTVASDKRLKQDIQPFREGLKEILQVNPVWFRYNGKAGMPTEKRFVGVIAQEMQKVAPHTISEFNYAESDGSQEKYLDYDANAMNYMLVNSVKELNALIHAVVEQQNQTIEQLKQEIAALKKGVLLPESRYGAARLWQNAPNPYASSTVIRYFVPEAAGTAQIVVLSVSGQEVYSRDLNVRGDGEIEISNNILSTGSYVYQLIVDGEVTDQKKMIVTR